ncbi:trehalose-phosphatase [Acinetobacter sp. NCu2D-2]|uniref:trehalose-phosphatase n=1 Tax=Acinetobacter sp. NCu2D-2 TaxID=1608473 RepID=UPI0007CDE82D|nr:trehalose-phosphatase [Acinetobacter sp. NCu2D-2]ANF81766.1 trehalose-phosphatase [Acinetobacter sp. NCu2D-2]
MLSQDNPLCRIKNILESYNSKPSDSKPSPFLLLLDIDGTISEFTLHPDDSFIAPKILSTLSKLQDQLSLYFVTGRSIQQAQNMIAPFDWNIIGSHGLEIYQNAELSLLSPFNTAQLAQLNQFINESFDKNGSVFIEHKTYSTAIHFREQPELHKQIKSFASQCAERFNQFEVKAGKYVFELVPKGILKGKAIDLLIQDNDFKEKIPIFIGDDITDESGFDVVNCYEGISIKVGIGNTHASYRLNDVTAVQNFLIDLCTGLQQQELSIGETGEKYVKTHCTI